MSDLDIDTRGDIYSLGVLRRKLRRPVFFRMKKRSLARWPQVLSSAPSRCASRGTSRDTSCLSIFVFGSSRLLPRRFHPVDTHLKNVDGVSLDVKFNFAILLFRKRRDGHGRETPIRENLD
jgi:hypothetical protein